MRNGVRTHAGIPLCLALLLAPGAVVGQTILNTERFQPEEADGFHTNATVSFSLEKGNSDVLNASTSGIVGAVLDAHWPRVIFGGRYLSDDQRSILDDQFLQLRYSWLFSEAARTFHFVQIQKNETLLLERRLLVGTGLRWTAVRTERARVALGTGAMGEWERLDPTRLAPGDRRRPEAVRMANVGVVSWEFEGGATVINIVYLQPDVSDFGDLRLLTDLGISIPITEHLGSTMTLEWRRDTHPPASLGRDDVTFSAGFSIDFP